MTLFRSEVTREYKSCFLLRISNVGAQLSKQCRTGSPTVERKLKIFYYIQLMNLTTIVMMIKH